MYFVYFRCKFNITTGNVCRFNVCGKKTLSNYYSGDYLPIVQFPISPFHWLSSQVISQWEPVVLQVTIALFPLCLIAY